MECRSILWFYVRSCVKHRFLVQFYVTVDLRLLTTDKSSNKTRLQLYSTLECGFLSKIATYWLDLVTFLNTMWYGDVNDHKII